MNGINRKFLILFTISYIIFACKKEQRKVKDSINSANNNKITVNDVSKLQYLMFDLSPEANTWIKNWKEYNKIKTVVDEVKEANFSFFNENSDNIKLLIKELKQHTPKRLKTPLVNARLLTVETSIQHLESILSFKTSNKKDVLSAVSMLINAFYNLNLQINKNVEFYTLGQ